RSNTRASLVSRAIYTRVTKDVKVTPADVKAFYKAHLSQYRLPATREIRQIVVRHRATAVQLRAKLERGASFAALARQSSVDQTASYGGLMTVRQGQTVPPLGVAFQLDTNELSQPLHGADGWHLILPVSRIEPASYQAIADVERPIRQTLLVTKREAAMKSWTKRLTASCAKTIEYARGFAPAK
ncbi:MAG: foldase protein PrsA, partial [Gaiellaceae bacterium]|nr:foldase protein PrsA [Gaiellaceae bacterium]